MLDRTRLPGLRNVEKRKLFTELRKVNELLNKIESKGMTEDLFIDRMTCST